MNCKIFVLIITGYISSCFSYNWLTKGAAEWIIQEFETRETQRNHNERPDRRSSSPFITGNGFRALCQHHCDDSNQCIMQPMSVQDNDFIFIKSDFYQLFVSRIMPRIHAKYSIISHNGDLSAPDGQSEYPQALGMPVYNTSDIIRHEYEKGNLLAHHGQNLWWHSSTQQQPRPSYLHCLPIGLENRQYAIGRYPHVYAQALRKYVLGRRDDSIDEERAKPLLLVAFTPKDYAPDRVKVLQHLQITSSNTSLWYHEMHLTHDGWLQHVNQHRFVLAPFGHGLDTHRISEILLMGAIPVMRRSTISSCYDDSDNFFNNTSRGSLPVVILHSWEDLTAERLEKEWDRITSYPKNFWDWKRLTLDHWIERIGMKR